MEACALEHIANQKKKGLLKNYEQFITALLNAVFRESIIYYGSDIIL